MAAENDAYFYSTAEASEKYIHNNIFYDFNNASGGFANGTKYNNNTGVGALSSSSFTLPSEGIIVIVARSGDINTDALDKIKTGMSTNPKLKFIIISESGGKENAQKFGKYIASDILHWTEATITHLPSSNYAAVPLDTNSYFATHFTGINAGLDTNPKGSGAHISNGGDTNEVHVHTYGVMECIPDKDRIFSYSQTRCQRTRGSTTATDLTYFKARSCYATGTVNDPTTFKVNNLMEDIVEGSFLSATLGRTGTTYRDNCSRSNPVSCEQFDATTVVTAVNNATSENNKYKANVKNLNEKNAAFSFAIPQWQSNYGQGACILFIDDGNLLDAQGQDKRCDNGDGTCSTLTQTDHAADIFSHVNQRKYIASKYLDAAKGSVCKQSPQTECTKWDITKTPAHKCELKQPSVNTAPSDIDINAGGAKCKTPAMWCDSKEENRKDRCDTAAGETPSTHCCTTKAAPSGNAAPVPTTGWPALLGLGALLPLLAARRRRK